MPIALAVRQHPVVDVAGVGVTPHDVADPVMVEVTDPDRDGARRMSADVDAAGPLTVFKKPDVDVIGRRVLPGDVARSVEIEVTRSERLPAGRMRAVVDAARPLAIADLPDVDIARGAEIIGKGISAGAQLRYGAGPRALRRQVHLAIADLDEAGPGVLSPVMVSMYEQLIVTQLLLGQPRNYTGVLNRLENKIAPGDVKRASISSRRICSSRSRSRISRWRQAFPAALCLSTSRTIAVSHRCAICATHAWRACRKH